MLEISFQYRTLFKFGIQHNFYSENQSNDFVIVPTVASQNHAKRLGLILKPNGSEISLLYDEEKIEGLNNDIQITYPFKFSFLVYNNNPYFINITNLPIENKNSILYFSNNKECIKSDNDFFLQNGDFVNDSDYLPISSTNMRFSSGEDELKIEIKDDRGIVFFEKTISKNTVYIPDLKNLREGKYTIFENDQEKYTFIHLSEISVRKPIALIEVLFAGELKNEIIEGIAANDIPFYSYKIQFESRSTFWKYIFIPKYNTALKNAIIQTNDKNITFSGPEEGQLSNGTKAIIYNSNSFLKLKERSEFNFQLKSGKTSQMGNGAKTIIDRLPLASIETIKPESRDKSAKVFSEIIVYI